MHFWDPLILSQPLFLTYSSHSALLIKRPPLFILQTGSGPSFQLRVSAPPYSIVLLDIVLLLPHPGQGIFQKVLTIVFAYTLSLSTQPLIISQQWFLPHLSTSGSKLNSFSALGVLCPFFTMPLGLQRTHSASLLPSSWVSSQSLYKPSPLPSQHLP